MQHAGIRGQLPPGSKAGSPLTASPLCPAMSSRGRRGRSSLGLHPHAASKVHPPTASCWGCRDGMGRWPARSQGRPEPGVAGARGGQASCVSSSEGVCRSRWLRGEHGPGTAPAGQAGWVGAGGEHVRGPSFRAARPAPRMPAPPGPAARSWVWGKELRPPRLGRCSVPGSQHPAPSTQHPAPSQASATPSFPGPHLRSLQRSTAATRGFGLFRNGRTRSTFSTNSSSFLRNGTRKTDSGCGK